MHVTTQTAGTPTRQNRLSTEGSPRTLARLISLLRELETYGVRFASGHDLAENYYSSVDHIPQGELLDFIMRHAQPAGE